MDFGTAEEIPCGSEQGGSCQDKIASLRNLAILILLIIAFSSCTRFFRKDNERILARVHDEYLYESDVAGIIPPGTPAADSINITRSYIENWIRERLMVRQAKNNLSTPDMDFSRQLEEYETSLAIYAYENELVRQKLDTLVTDIEIMGYYDANPAGFPLWENVLRFRYVRLPVRSREISGIRHLMRLQTQDGSDRIAELCIKAGGDYHLDDSVWWFFNDLIQEIPLRVADPAEFLRSRRETEVQDSVSVYLVSISEYRLKGEAAPVDLVKNRIRDIILNKRKVTLLTRMQEDVYQTALKNNHFEIY